jgi:hypothetical protein
MNDTNNIEVVDVPDEVPSSSSSITILPSLNDVLQCQCSSWYPIFSNLQLLRNEQQQYMKGRYKNNNVTIKSYIIKPLPQEFIDYLVSNEQQFILPNNTRTSSILLEARNNNDNNNPNDIWSSDDENENDDNDNEDNTTTKTELDTIPNQSAFHELNQQIKFGIQSLYKNKTNHNKNDTNHCCIIPKLNWSSPKDAIWINNGTMKCYCPGDIYLLFKASDFITYDVTYAIQDVVISNNKTITTTTTTTTTSITPAANTTSNNENESNITIHKSHDKVQTDSVNLTSATSSTTSCRNSDTTNTFHHQQQQPLSSSLPSISEFSYELVLRKYCNLYPSQEFRCFISYNHIIGISQRYIGQQFIFLQSMKNQYIHYIYDFYKNIIQPNVKYMEQYVIDIYIDQKHRIWILDFNVWGTRTDALLFHWSELIQKAQHVQYINSDTNDSDDSTNIEFRIVESILDQNKQQQQQMIYPNPLSNYKAPLDALFLNSSNYTHNKKYDSNIETMMEPSSINTTTTTFHDFMKLCVRPSTIVDSDSDAENSDGGEQI